jgi:hypothetical protein
MGFLALISPLLGVFTSVIPGILEMFKQRQDNQHERDMVKLRMDAAVQGVDLSIKLEEAKADANEGQSIRQHDSSISGGWFIDALRASIRPVITYIFFILFVTIKVSALVVMLKTGMPITEALPAIWDMETTALFGAIMGFWFGSRTIERQKKLSAPVIVTKIKK